MGILVTEKATGEEAVVLFKQGSRLLEPSVYRTCWKDQPAVIKDYSRYRGTLLAPVARWMVRHEAKMLRLLKDWPHAPRLRGVIDGLALVMEFVPGQNLDEIDAVDQDMFRQLQSALGGLHAAGITHNDVRRTNILISEGRPVLVDFTSAWRFPRWLRGNPISRQLHRGDYGNFLKLREHMLGIAPTAEEAAKGAEAPWVGRLRQGWKRFYRRHIKNKDA